MNMNEKKFSEYDEAVRSKLIDHIDRRWGQLYELEKEWGERAYKFLFMTNSGGAIATLTFIGTGHASNLPSIKTSLTLFVLGVILVGVGTAKTYHHMSGLLKHYKSDVNDLFNSELYWSELRKKDDGRAVADTMDYVIPYAAFGTFIVGSLVAGVGLFC